MNSTNMANIFLAVSWSSFGAIGLIGNIVLVAILSKNFRNSEPYEKVIFAALLTDLCTCINFSFLQPFGILGRATFFCKTAAFFFALFMNMNQIWIAINMFSRYLALYHQNLYKRWFKVSGILLCYAIAIIVNLPVVVPMIYYDVFGLNIMRICGANPINMLTTICALSIQFFTIVSNVLCVIFGYLVVKKIRGHISHIGSGLNSNLVEESRQIVAFVCVSAIVPIVVQSPTTVIRVLQYVTTIDPWFSRALTSFFPLVPASAPFITAVIIKPYRKKVRKLFAWRVKNSIDVARTNVVSRQRY